MRKALTIAALCTATLGCGGGDRLVVDSGVGVSTVRSGCPAVAIPDHTGDITLFNPANSRLASDIDIVANISNLRATCNSEGARIYSEASFDIFALRSDANGVRQVTIPYFSTVVQGGTVVVAKRVGQVTLTFADGQLRAQGSAKAGSFVDAAAARLPDDIIEKITRRRKPGDPDAALDPLADPEVRREIARASFEQLIGIQLTQEQLRYNATR